jgi:hypothetical protein
MLLSYPFDTRFCVDEHVHVLMLLRDSDFIFDPIGLVDISRISAAVSPLPV